MDKRHTLIFGLEEGKVIAHPNEYFTNSEKHTIIEELFLQGLTPRTLYQQI